MGTTVSPFARALREPFVSFMCAVLVASAGPGAALAGEPTVSDRSLQQSVDVRAAYGLPADPTAVAALVGSREDVGSEEWGIPLTRSEIDALDLNRRNAFVTAIGEQLAPYVRSLPTFGGIYIDQPDGGGVVVQLTELNEAEVTRIRALDPADSLGLRIVEVKHSRKALEDAARSLSKSWRTSYPETKLVGVAVDTEQNLVRVEVDAGSLETTAAPAEVYASAAQEAASAVGVPIVVVPSELGSDVVCTSRDNCYTPLRAGVRIRDGSTSGVNWCTMGFMVIRGTSDIQFLTAGHCYKKGVSNTWYHKNYGLLGSEQATMYGEDGYDVMRVNMPNTQESELIYGVSGSQQIASARDPITNEGVCFSGARTDAVVCGTVTDDFRTWVSETCDCNVWGGDTNLAPNFGDSGAPLYSRTYITGVSTPYWLNTPIGIVDHEFGYFASVTAALWSLGVTIYK